MFLLLVHSYQEEIARERVAHTHTCTHVERERERERGRWRKRGDRQTQGDSYFCAAAVTAAAPNLVHPEDVEIFH